MRKFLQKSLALVLVLATALTFAACSDGKEADHTGNVVEIAVDGNVYGLTAEETTLTQVVESVKDTVVEITTETVTTGSFMQQYVTEGAGSGVIISADGYIVTNDHVVSGAESIRVTIASGETYQADLVGTDAKADIAVIKIEGSDFPAAVLGTSSDLKVGQSVIAIGNPLGSLGGTVTEGIVSALDRTITVESMKMTLIQTTAAINPGNSGGGLFDMYGRLIAVVNAKSSGEGIEGLGFAIPIDYAGQIAEELIENGYVAGRPALGVSLSFRNFSTGGGMMQWTTLPVVTEVRNSGSPLQVNDVILSIDGTTCSSADALVGFLYSDYVAGDGVSVKVQRNGETQTLSVTLVDAHDFA